MYKTSIDWCDYTWNPVWGCLKYPPCEYCYARRIAKRFATQVAEKEYWHTPKFKEIFKKEIYKFFPTFLPSNFNQAFPKRPSRIFVGSMSEIYFWRKEWMERVLKKIRKHPQHNFLFLTKFPIIYEQYEFPINCWLGITITWGEATHILFKHLKVKNIKFISFEPLLDDVNVSYFDNFEGKRFPDWVIIGAQTNPVKLPQREWVEKIIDAAKANEIPVFVKENLWRSFPEYKINQFPVRSEGYGS